MTTQPNPAAAAARSVRVRMYRHGLGDCFLLRFAKDGATGETFNILIDCGVIAVAQKPKDKMAEVLADIRETTNKRLDVVVLTHEHWDHVSGFSTQQAQSLFDDITIGEVWYAWTEDPANKLGKRLRDERAAKLKTLEKAAVGLQAQHARLAAADPNSADSKLAEQRHRRVSALLRFFGVDEDDPLQAEGLGVAAGDPKIGKTRAAFEYLAGRRDVKTRYVYSKNGPILLPGVAGVRVFPMGPPEDEQMIKRSAPTKKGQEVYELAGDMPMDENLAAAFVRLAGGQEADAVDDGPFDGAFRRRPVRPSPPQEQASALDWLVHETWDAVGSDWRRIDQDWTAAAETLALDLDNHTNNTCLVLAFELGPNGKVLLFAADAQVGNWLSWQDLDFRVNDAESTRQVTGPQLLSRTVFYKVGHHGSHNATLRSQGLEQMTSSELVAFVPDFREQAEKSGWKEMPFGPLVTRLGERSGGRVVFSDPKENAPAAADLRDLSKGDRDRFLASLKTDKLFYEYELPL